MIEMQVYGIMLHNSQIVITVLNYAETMQSSKVHIL
jgi:hypothetical protein